MRMLTLGIILFAACFQPQTWASGTDGIILRGAFETRPSQNPPQRKKIKLREEDKAERMVKLYLKDSGIPESFIEAAFKDPRKRIDEEIVKKFNSQGPALTYKEFRKLFINEKSLELSSLFYGGHKNLIGEIARGLRVDPLIFLSIAGVETVFGAKTGNHSAFNAFYTMIHRLAHRKAGGRPMDEWAAAQMGDLFKFTFKNGPPDILGIPSSYAGAVGYVQFMPASLVYYSLDWDQNKTIELFSWPDQLASAANYLIKNGYQPGSLDFHKGSPNWNAIYAYNHSEFYVRVVLEFREEIRARLSTENHPAIFMDAEPPGAAILPSLDFPRLPIPAEKIFEKP